MKNIKTIHILVLTFCSIFIYNSQAQNWNLLQEGKQWNIVSESSSHGILYSRKTYAIKFMNDTLVNDTLYKGVYHSSGEGFSPWSLCCFVREDDEGFYLRQNAESNEGQLYTYNLKVGDVAIVNNCSYGCSEDYKFEALVEKIDSVLINGVYKKHYKLHWLDFGDSFDGKEDWIEGIGSLSGIIDLTTRWFVTGGLSNLLCYFENDQLLYKNHLLDLSECYYDYALPIDDLQTENLNIYPNPVTNTLQITGASNLESYKILNINGQSIMQGNLNNNQLNVSTLNSGIYILEVYIGDLTYRQKFIKTQ